MKAKCSLYSLIFNVTNFRHFLHSLYEYNSDFLAFYEQLAALSEATPQRGLLHNKCILSVFVCPGFLILQLLVCSLVLPNPVLNVLEMNGNNRGIFIRFFSFFKFFYPTQSLCLKSLVPRSLRSNLLLNASWPLTCMYPQTILRFSSGFFAHSLFVFNRPYFKCHNRVNTSYWSQTLILFASSNLNHLYFLWRYMPLHRWKALHFLRY